MRTTVRLDDELLERLKAEARKEKVSLTRLLNRTLRAGLRANRERRRPQAAYRERARAMGVPRLPLDKALALASALEDDEIVRELMSRK
jgi:hypothetical protein